MSAPVHQQDMFNIEVFDGSSWRGGMNRASRDEAVSIAKHWAAENQRRYRVYSPGGQLTFDTDTSPGISLRNHFATHAMHAELVTCGVPGRACDALIDEAAASGRTPEQQIAWNAYRMADAMIAAGEVQS